MRVEAKTTDGQVHTFTKASGFGTDAKREQADGLVYIWPLVGDGSSRHPLAVFSVHNLFYIRRRGS